MPDAVVIGAGIAGLAAAWELQQRGVRPLVIEQQSRAGGVILTEKINGFVIDAGPDSLLVHKPAAVDLCHELGIADRLFPTLPPRTAFVVRDGALVPLPEASFLGLPTSIRPFVQARLFSWPGKARMAAELILPARREESDESIGSFMRRRFGAEAVEYLAEPLLAGIHAGEVEQLSVHALFPRLVDAERTRGSVLRSLFATRPPPAPSGATPGAFVSFPGGISELVQALVTRLGGDAIRHDCAVARVAGSGPYTVTLASGEAVAARAVIAATPAWSAASILQPVSAPLAVLCRDIPYASSATVFVALERDQVRHPLAGSGYVVPRRQRRALMAATWVSSKWPQRAPAGHVLLRGFLGGASDPDVLAKTDGELASAAFDDLAEMLGISGKPLLTRVFRWPRASAQYHVGHLARVRAIDDHLSRLPGLYLTGSGYRGTGIPDCIADARLTAARAAAFLAG
jgi:oxygen-dependent protoporphyrinogen oxidase